MTDQIDYVKEYDNSARVENSAELLDKFINDAVNYRGKSTLVVDYDVEYGPEPRNKMDIFWPDNKAGNKRKSPIVLFIHGGYWQMMDRTAFSHLAAGLNSNGIAVAIPSYTLCPDISIEGIITEMRRVCLVLYQTYKRKITVVGHSAGGHLAACMLATDWEGMHSGLPHDLVASGLGISGLYDLLPLLKTPTNDAVGMDEEQAISASPIHWIPEAIQQFDAWVGSEESNEYHRQSRELAAKWSMLGTPTKYVSDEGTNHFTIIDALAKAESDLTKRIVELVKKPALKPKLQKLDEEAVLQEMQIFGEAENTPPPEPAPEQKSSAPNKPTTKKKTKVKISAKKDEKLVGDKQKSAPQKRAKPPTSKPPKKRGISKAALTKHAKNVTIKKAAPKKAEKPIAPKKPSSTTTKKQPQASIGGKSAAQAKAIRAKKNLPSKK